MNKLIIDTTDREMTKISLRAEKTVDTLENIRSRRSQNTLILIEKLLKKNKITVKEIDEIEVNEGPGSFTGTRVGVSIANALGFGIGTKVNGEKSKQILPRYK